MDRTPSPLERPEDLLDAMARGDGNLGERLVAMARAAATVDRASILDLLLDDAVPAAPSQSPMAAPEVVVRATGCRSEAA